LSGSITLLGLLLIGLTGIGRLVLGSLIALVSLIWLIHRKFLLHLPTGHFVRFRDAGNLVGGLRRGTGLPEFAAHNRASDAKR
jgi:hypothetical protein